MIKAHCDRCDAIVEHDNRGFDTAPTFLEEKGLPQKTPGAVRALVEVSMFDGNDWKQIHLCDSCFIQLLIHIGGRRLEEIPS